MSKNTLAIAIAAALAVPMAAQADTTLYGQAHASIDYLTADEAVGDQDDDGIAVANNSSRIGIKGSHKLSDSLSAIYQMEWGVGLDGEGQNLSKRNRLVGLKGGFGTFILGRHDTPMKVVGRKADLFWSTQLGQNRSLTARDPDGGVGFDARLNNVIGYISPNFGPAHIFAAYSTDTGVGGTLGSTITEDNDRDAVSVALIVGGGKKPYYVGVGYEVHNIDVVAGQDDESALRVAGSYKFGPVKVAGFYQMGTDIGFIEDNDRDIFGLGAAYTAGSNTFKAQWYRADESDAGADSDGADMYAIGWDHALSKSTSVYAQYAALDNDDNGNWSLGGSGHGEVAVPTTGEEASGFSGGIRIKF